MVEMPTKMERVMAEVGSIASAKVSGAAAAMAVGS